MLQEGIPFSNTPGIAYEYSNYGFAILGRIVSKASGKAYDAYISQNILQPLGMTSTTLHPSEVAANRRAVGYRWEDERWKEEPPLPHGSFGSMGGMLTSIRDLSKYVSVFLDAWPPRDGQERGPIRRASLREMGRRGARRRPGSCDPSTARPAAHVRQLRVRPERHADVRLQQGDCAQRRPARLRIAMHGSRTTASASLRSGT
jgi:CubicO group peptidase (beta-lactamase class C family)